MTDQDNQTVGGVKPPAPKAKRNAIWGSLGIFIGIVLAITLRHAFEKPDAPAAAFIPTCESPDARDTVKNAVEHNVSENLITLKLLDMQNIKELKASKTQRLCSATVVLNSGREETRYIVSRASDGSVLVELGPNLDIQADVAPAPQAATEAPSAPTAPVAQGPVDQMDIAALSKAYPVALDRWSAAVSALGAANTLDWARDMDGIFDPAKVVEVAGRKYIFVSFSPQHMGGIQSANIMFSEDQARVFGMLQDTQDEQHEISVGSPSDAELACLRRLAGGEAPAACN